MIAVVTGVLAERAGDTIVVQTDGGVGYAVTDPLPVLPVFALVQRLGEVSDAEMDEVFNMGCGFCCLVPADQTDAAVELLDSHHAGTAVIGHATGDTGVVELPGSGLVSRGGEGFQAR